MKFSNVYVENSILELPRTQKILSSYSSDQIISVDEYEPIFNKYRKPYLTKRYDLNLFLARKKGTLVKETPDAYGVSGEKHYFFYHALNCIFECEYCYLQGYFKSPDIVLFLNYEDIAQEIKEILAKENSNKKIWFHAGEFSDSLAMASFTNEWEFFFNLFSGLENAHLELRTKSSNIKSLLGLKPSKNITVSFSMSTEHLQKKFDHKTSSIKARIKAMQALAQSGFNVGVHLDPIFYYDSFVSDYNELLKELLSHVPQESIDYVSIGTVRFSKDVFRSFKKNYPDSSILHEEFVTGFDDKIRYINPVRKIIYSKIKEIFKMYNFPEHKIYECMESAC